jgi:peptidoglycan/xylan/chitin deacetylase (PgdA/CDA1 family)
VEIAVAVCSRSGSRTLGLCLDALHTDGVHPSVHVAQPGHGLAKARNDALETTSSKVLAFVEDDIVVAEGWRQALQDAWDGAPANQGCVGGPIGVCFTGPRPAWLTDALLRVLGVSRGDSTFHGGNVSFRTDALRGIQGFLPLRGRPELHDWFCEEHHAQQELAAAGWTAVRAPNVTAARIVDPEHLSRRTLLARQAQYGARWAQAGERRPRAVAARITARSAAGLAVALARRDNACAMERAARVAENVGVVVGRLVAHRGLQPAATQTPFRHSVSAPQPLFPKRSPGQGRRGPVVLVYHRVDDEAGAGVSPANFASQLEVLRHDYTPAPLETIVNSEAPSDAVAVTFDDGYAATMRRVLPMLAKTAVPATLFVVTGNVGAQRAFWWDRVRSLLRGPRRPLKLTIEGETRAWADARAAEAHIIAWLQSKTPETIDEVLGELRAWAGDWPGVPEEERPLSIDELRALAAFPLIAIDAHTRTHPNLRHVDEARRMEELTGSREDLAQWLDIDPPVGLAYPYGTPGADVDHATRASAKAAGFSYATLNVDGRVTRTTDRFALPRLAPANVGGDDFADLIARAKRPRRR